MFEFATANRIVFGEDSVYKIIPTLRDFGNQALVVLGLSEQYSQPVLNAITEQGISLVMFRAKGEPSIESVQTAIDLARNNKIDMVIGMERQRY